MKMPSYVNPNGILPEGDLDHILKDLPSAVMRGKIYAHVAVTNAIIKEMAIVEGKGREHIASWLDEQGGIYTTVAKAIRDGKTPTLKQPAPQIEPLPLGLEAKLREALTEAVQQRDALQVEVEALRAGGNHRQTHPKPWAVRRKDGSMEYHDTRAAARRASNGDIVVDCR